ncbi:MAG TPA: hypothetical protein VKY73_11440 [Polyangiaceae bacterium]|nr:hypothetical protein [Polyangiaceae bacterium]
MIRPFDGKWRRKGGSSARLAAISGAERGKTAAIGDQLAASEADQPPAMAAIAAIRAVDPRSTRQLAAFRSVDPRRTRQLAAFRAVDPQKDGTVARADAVQPPFWGFALSPTPRRCALRGDTL